MATFTGSATPGRIPILDITLVSRSATKAVVRYTFRSNPTSNYYTTGTFVGTLVTNGGNFSISSNVPSGASATHKSVDVTFNTSQAFTATGSVTGSIPGTVGWASTSLSGSMSVPAGGTKPGAPTNWKQSRVSGTELKLTWSKGSGATSTEIVYRRDEATTDSALTTSTGTSYETWGYANHVYKYWARSVNAVGKSAWTSVLRFYTTPTAPSKPTVGANRLVSWSNRGLYTNAVQVQRTNDSGATTTTVNLGAVTSWTDPVAQKPLTQYRVRTRAGDEGEADTLAAWSEWSAWSDNAMAATYKKPVISKLDVYRVNAAGERTEMGTYARVTATFNVQSVKDGATETNWVTRKVQWRLRGSTGAYTTTNLVTKSTSQFGARTLASPVGGGGFDPTKSYEVRYLVEDAYTGAVYAYADLPVAQVAFSVAESGVGAGKTWERGALDVGGDVYVEGDLHLADPNVIVIGGVAYQASGTLDVKPNGWTPYGACDGTLALPEPPAGWVYTVAAVGATADVWWSASAVRPWNNGQPIALAYWQTAVPALSVVYTVAWRLVKVS